MEKLLKQVLHELEAIKCQVAEIPAITSELQSIKRDLGTVKEDLGSVKQEVQTIKQDLGSVKQEVSEIKVQQTENTGFIKALLHRTEELDAKYDSLLHTTATKDIIANLATKNDVEQLRKKLDQIEQNQITQGESINILALRQLQQEAQINLLKQAK